jgi:perosamine synthetase
MERKIPYGRQSIDELDRYGVDEVMKSDYLTTGPAVREFEKAFAEITGATYAVAVSSGTAALHLACLAAGLAQGDELITSAISFVASANCALYCGATPSHGRY